MEDGNTVLDSKNYKSFHFSACFYILHFKDVAVDRTAQTHVDACCKNNGDHVTADLVKGDAMFAASDATAEKLISVSCSRKCYVVHNK